MFGAQSLCNGANIFDEEAVTIYALFAERVDIVDVHQAYIEADIGQDVEDSIGEIFPEQVLLASVRFVAVRNQL